MKRTITGPVGLAAACLAASLAFSVPSRADEPTNSNNRIREQLDEDVTPVPVGMGAIFVPSLSDSFLEPRVTVYYRGERVASGGTGERIVLPPGHYIVTVGEGSRDHQASTEVRVVDGVTTPVKPFFGALRVQLTNTEGDPQSQTFVIRSADGKRVYGPYATTNDPDAPKARTLLLPAGNYVIAMGTKPDATEDAAAFTIVSDKLIRYRLVTDGDRLLRTEFADKDVRAEHKVWRLNWVIGGSGSFSQNKNQLAGFRGSATMIDTYSQLYLAYDNGPHLAQLNVDFQQSFMGFDTEHGASIPLFPLHNDTVAELSYALRLGGILGPYARGTVHTAMFEDSYLPDGPVTVITHDESGTPIKQRTADSGDKVPLFSWFAPTAIQEGAGVMLSPFDNDTFTLNFRAGGAMRQAFYGQGRFVDDRDGDTINMMQLDDTSEYGGEATGFALLRISHDFSAQSRLDSFVPKEQLLDGEKLRPIFRWDNTVALRLGRAASLVYTYSLGRQHLALKNLEQMQGISLRFQHVVF